eukprot:gene31136-39071_t
MAGSELLREPVRVAYADGVSAPPDEEKRPGAREVSLAFMQRDNGVRTLNPRGGTDFLTYVGQFFDHEFDLNEHSWFEYGQAGEDSPIRVPACDQWFDPECSGNATLPFTRTGFNGSVP